ncbi:putative bifunctional diguanylate cyclase/phosphodiesterase [Cellvibrio zantedeschiae]|nr:bifunctional diguanylate cyclase/phosphodiesterase [Cellvibrio zantedeschiae]
MNDFLLGKATVPALLAAMDALTLEQDFQIFFKKAATSVCKLLNADGAALILLDERREFFEYHLFEGAQEERLNPFKGMRFPANEGIAGRALKLKSSIYVRDYSQDMDAMPDLIKGGLAANFVIPLISSDQVIGVLASSWFSEPADVIPPQIFLLAERIASQIAVACHREQLEKQLRSLVSIDPLTQLNNRHGIMQFLDQKADQLARHNRSFALFFIDLDGLKTANDQWGHEVGDNILRDAANRLRDVVRKSDCIGRLGGDEFLIIAECDEHSLAILATRFIQALRIHFGKGRKRGRISASVGIAFSPVDGTEPNTLLRKADAAMYSAKKEGGDRFNFASRIATSESEKSISAVDIENALDSDEICLWYQPIISLRNKHVIGYESLVRWQKADGQLVGALPIIKAIESARGDLEIRFGNWILQKSAQQISEWKTQDFFHDIHINISARHFLHPSFLQELHKIHTQYADACHSLIVEITESAMLDDMERARRIILRCQELGVRVAADDFGTGYSSLTYLKYLPLNSLKIDRSFVTDLPHNQVDRDIVSGIVSIAHALNLLVVAEGAENDDQLESLRALGCDQLQGYVISQPMPLEQVMPWHNLYKTRSNNYFERTNAKLAAIPKHA